MLSPTCKQQFTIHGDRLTVVIAGKLVNVSALARELNVDQSNLSKFLAGKRNSTIPYARRVASKIGVSIDTLLDAIDARQFSSCISQ